EIALRHRLGQLPRIADEDEIDPRLLPGQVDEIAALDRGDAGEPLADVDPASKVGDRHANGERELAAAGHLVVLLPAVLHMVGDALGRLAVERAERRAVAGQPVLEALLRSAGGEMACGDGEALLARR